VLQKVVDRGGTAQMVREAQGRRPQARMVLIAEEAEERKDVVVSVVLEDVR
jgi:hypothetical protein